MIAIPIPERHRELARAYGFAIYRSGASFQAVADDDFVLAAEADISAEAFARRVSLNQIPRHWSAVEVTPAQELAGGRIGHCL